MSDSPSVDDLFRVIAAASIGETQQRVALPERLNVGDPTTKLAIALNLLLDDLEYRHVESKQRFEALRRTEEQLRHSQKMESIGRLASGVAHDFNNLLSVILSYGELVQSGLAVDDPLRSELGEIVKAGERAATLTRQLLAFSRQQLVEPRVIDLHELLRGMDSMLRRLVGEQVELTFTLAEGLDRIKADLGHVEQVVMNLAINARDAMPEGGTLAIETCNVVLDEASMREHPDALPGPHVMLSVTDSGVGLDEATRARIFEPFFTTKGRGRGTGLGLSMVYGIVKQSGGSIWVQSEVGQGSTFKVLLPRASEPPVSLRPPLPITRTNGTETVLVAEDDEQVRAVVAAILRRGGYTVLDAANAEEALQHASQPLHLLLTDVVMPKVNGQQLAELLWARQPELRVLFMSGYTHDVVVHDDVVDAGLCLLEKPFTPQALLARVREVLEAPARKRR